MPSRTETWQRFAGLDVRLVCDLRSERERVLQPSRWPQGMQTHQMVLNVAADIRSGDRALLDMLRARPGADGARAMMTANYRRYPGRFGSRSRSSSLTALRAANAAQCRCWCIVRSARIAPVS